MKITLFFTLLISTLTINAQFMVSGDIMDENKNAIAFANVVLVDTAKENTVKGVVSDIEGKFSFKNITKGHYTLKVSYIGFKSYNQNIILDKKLTVPSIIMIEASEALGEVVVIAKKPTVVRKVDRLVFNVANSTLSTGNAWDILKNTPGVIVNQDNLMIRNSGNIIILINDKRVYLSNSELKTLLEGTSGTDITAVEVITNPPAKYEAEGGAVLNIKMKKSNIEGYKGSVNASYRQSVYARYQLGTSHFYKTNKTNSYFSYSNSRGKSNRLEEEVINFSNADNSTNFHSFLDRNSWYNNHNLRWNTEFSVSPKSTIILGAQWFNSPDWKAKNTTDSRVKNTSKELISSFFTKNDAGNKTNNLGVDIDYELKLDDKGQKITANAQMTSYEKKGDQNVSAIFYLANGDFDTDKVFDTNSNQKTKIYSAKVDYENAINDDTKLEAGIKYAQIKSDSDLEHFNHILGDLVLDTNKSNSFLYKEENFAGYASYETQFNKLSIKAGLRAEYTMLNGNSLTLAKENTNTYLKLFPTVYVQYKANDNHDFGLSYGKRINRPSYSSLNPFKFYFGDYSYYEGNPNLKPTIAHNIDFQYTLKKKYNFTVYYNTTNDDIMEVNYQDNSTNKLRFTNINTEINQSYGANFFTNLSLNNNWSMYFTADVTYDEDQFAAQENNNEIIKNSKWIYYAYISTSYQFLEDKSLTAELSFYAVTDGIQGALNVSANQDMSFGITKKMMKDKLSLSLRFTDILNTQVLTISTDYLDQQNYFIDNKETESIRFGIKYNFGNQGIKKRKSKSKSDEQQRL